MSLCQQRLTGHWQLILYFRDVRAKENEKEGDTILVSERVLIFYLCKEQVFSHLPTNTDKDERQICMEFIGPFDFSYAC